MLLKLPLTRYIRHKVTAYPLFLADKRHAEGIPSGQTYPFHQYCTNFSALKIRSKIYQFFLRKSIFRIRKSFSGAGNHFAPREMILLCAKSFFTARNHFAPREMVLLRAKSFFRERNHIFSVKINFLYEKM